MMSWEAQWLSSQVFCGDGSHDGKMNYQEVGWWCSRFLWLLLCVAG
jgi:hypothetical protein